MPMGTPAEGNSVKPNRTHYEMRPRRRETSSMKAKDLVDDFISTDQNGNTVRLSELVANGPMVLFFYPKAMTPG